MTELNKLTIASALSGLAKGEFTSVELTEAHLKAMAANKDLNAYIIDTPEIALAQAKASDERRKAGKAGVMEGIPVAVKDLL